MVTTGGRFILLTKKGEINGFFLIKYTPNIITKPHHAEYQYFNINQNT